MSIEQRYIQHYRCEFAKKQVTAIRDLLKQIEEKYELIQRLPFEERLTVYVDITELLRLVSLEAQRFIHKETPITEPPTVEEYLKMPPGSKTMY